MAIGLQILFLAEQYHGTPWGHHVNEGLVEWPPCPWRIFRSLIAVGLTKCAWTEVPADVRRLFNKMSCIEPSYYVPEVLITHTRHYMPHTKRNKNQTLVFDTWARPIKGEIKVAEAGPRSKTAFPMQVLWEAEFNDRERQILEQLAAKIGYIGRAESWAQVSVITKFDAEPNVLPIKEGNNNGNLSRITKFDTEPNVLPLESASSLDKVEKESNNWEVIRLLGTESSEVYKNWREAEVRKRLEGLEPGRKLTAKLKKARAKAVEPYPESLVDCFMVDTIDWQKHGWNRPPGSKTCLYRRKSHLTYAFVAPGVAHRKTDRNSAVARFVLFSVATHSRRRSGLPVNTDVFLVGRAMHAALCWKFNVACDKSKGARKLELERSKPLILGRTDERKPAEGHRHCHILPLCLWSRDKIDHILVDVPGGLHYRALEIVKSVTRLRIRQTGMDYELTCVGSGHGDIFDSLGERVRRNVRKIVTPAVAPSRHWKSLTPFVPARFLKKSGRNSLMGQIENECRWRNLPLARIRPVPLSEMSAYQEKVHSMRGFRLNDQRRRSPKAYRRYYLQLEFEEPVTGPMTLGYGSHYGLGLFAQCNESV